MNEHTYSYALVDEYGDIVVTINFTHRYCQCGSPGCVDDEISLVLPGDPDDCVCRLQVPRLMTPYIEGVFDGSLKVKNP